MRDKGIIEKKKRAKGKKGKREKGKIKLVKVRGAKPPVEFKHSETSDKRSKPALCKG